MWHNFICCAVKWSAFYATEGLYAGVFAPQVEATLAWHTVTADVVGGGVEHALAHVSVEIGVVVVSYPLAARYRLGVGEGVVVGCEQRLRRRYVLPRDVF